MSQIGGGGSEKAKKSVTHKWGLRSFVYIYDTTTLTTRKIGINILKVAVWRAFTATLIFRKVGKIFLRSLFVLELNLNSYNNDFKDIKNWENIFKVAFCLLWFSYDNDLNFFFLTFCLFKVAAIRTFFTCPDCNSSDLKNHKNWENKC